MWFAPWLEIWSDLTTALARLTKEEKSDPAIKHALLIRSAWALSNYHTFFQLYLSAPNMSGYLLDLFVQRERVQALKAMVKSWVVFVLYLLSPLLISLFVVDKCLEVVKWLNSKICHNLAKCFFFFWYGIDWVQFHEQNALLSSFWDLPLMVDDHSFHLAV